MILSLLVLCEINWSLLAVAAEVSKPTVTIHPAVLTVQQGQHAEFRCTATGSPAPSFEWTGKVEPNVKNPQIYEILKGPRHNIQPSNQRLVLI